jgi:glycosyltransferase involved in cell wall biosynthesis
VAIDATPLLGQPTGVGAFCAGLLGALARHRGVEVGAFAVSWRRRRGLGDRLPTGVAWHRPPMPARPLHWAWRHGGLPPIDWFVGAVDVVHGTNFVVPPSRRAALVITVHDLTTVRYPELCDPSTLAFPALIRQALRRGAWVHTPSVAVADEVVATFAVEPGRVRPVASGVPPLGDVAGAPGVVLAPHLERYVVAVGTAEPRKDLPGLVEAFGLLAGGRPELGLVLVGPPGWGEADLEAAIAASPARRQIVRTGWLSEAALGRAIRGAAALAYPSRYEGFGFPPLQAMAAGVPVVATAVGALPEVLGDAALLVDGGDPGALAGALGRVLDSPGLADELRGRGVRRAAGFTWEACADGLVGLYADAVAAR